MTKLMHDELMTPVIRLIKTATIHNTLGMRCYYLMVYFSVKEFCDRFNSNLYPCLKPKLLGFETDENIWK